MAKKKTKRRTRALGGSTEHHDKASPREFQRSRTLAAEAINSAERGRCSDALTDLTLAAIAYGRGEAHAQEARHHERPALVAARDILSDARDAIRACHKAK